MFLRNRPVAQEGEPPLDELLLELVDAAGAGRRRGRGGAAVSPARARGGTPPTVVVRSDYGLPYSKGLMAQSLMATGLPSERSFALAQQIEERLIARASTEISVDELRAVAEEVVAAGEGEPVLARFRQWWNVRNLERPLLVLLGGVTGVGQVDRRDAAGRAARDPARDRHRPGAPGRARVLLARVPAVGAPLLLRRLEARCPTLAARRRSGTVAGFMRQAHDIAPGLDAVVERAISDRTPMVVEGVHLLPGHPERAPVRAGDDGARDAGRARRGRASRALPYARDADAARAASATWRRSTGSASCRTTWWSAPRRPGCR